MLKIIIPHMNQTEILLVLFIFPWSFLKRTIIQTIWSLWTIMRWLELFGMMKGNECAMTYYRSHPHAQLLISLNLSFGRVSWMGNHVGERHFPVGFKQVYMEW